MFELFHKKKSQQVEDLDAKVLHCKIELRKLQEKCQIMLQRELATARALRAQNKRDVANDSRIGTDIYMLRLIDKASHRLDDISSTAQLNELFGGLNALMKQVGSMSSQVHTADIRTLEKQAGALERDMSVRNFDMNAGSGMVSLDEIERMISGETSVENAGQTIPRPQTAPAYTEQAPYNGRQTAGPDHYASAYSVPDPGTDHMASFRKDETAGSNTVPEVLMPFEDKLDNSEEDIDSLMEKMQKEFENL